jgi:hypothetical protein
LSRAYAAGHDDERGHVHRLRHKPPGCPAGEEDHRRLVARDRDFILTRATNAKTEAANVTIKNIKRTGRGYRSPANYRCRIMAYNAARSAA